MSEATRTIVGTLLAGAVLGLLGDALLRATPWGINLLLWVGAFGIVAGALARRRILPVGGDGRWMAVPALFFAAAFAWRDSPVLAALNGLGLLVCLALAALRTRSGRLSVASVTEYSLGVPLVWLHALVGSFPLLLRDTPWQEIPRGGWQRHAGAVGRGIAIALPLLLLFGALFASADAVFARLAADLFTWDTSAIASHLAQTFFWALVAGGMLRELLLVREWAGWMRQRPTGLSLGIVEIGVALGLLNALFLAFVLIQVRYLFGGASLVAVSPGLTFAEYARRGFFELVTVSALTLPLLLGAHWTLPQRRWHGRLFTLLAGTTVALLFLIMGSAVYRMRLYQAVYGLTELRFYTTVFMGWLAVVFLWFLATVLRGRRDRFAFGAMVTGLAIIALLDLANPDASIARTNLARMRTGRPFDAGYLAGLSADAVPTLIGALPGAGEKERSLLAKRILSRWSPPARHDWRTWNASRASAWEAVGTQRTRLEEAAGLNEKGATAPGPVSTPTTTAPIGPPVPEEIRRSPDEPTGGSPGIRAH